jgi:hypothetical protein
MLVERVSEVCGVDGVLGNTKLLLSGNSGDVFASHSPPFLTSFRTTSAIREYLASFYVVNG